MKPHIKFGCSAVFFALMLALVSPTAVAQEKRPTPFVLLNGKYALEMSGTAKKPDGTERAGGSTDVFKIVRQSDAVLLVDRWTYQQVFESELVDGVIGIGSLVDGVFTLTIDRNKTMYMKLQGKLVNNNRIEGTVTGGADHEGATMSGKFTLSLISKPEDEWADNAVFAIEVLREVHKAQQFYLEASGGEKFAPGLQDLYEKLQVPDGKSMSGDLADLYMRAVKFPRKISDMQIKPKSGYLLGSIKVMPKTKEGGPKYFITASPAVKTGPEQTGNDCFYIDETGVVRHSGSSTLAADAKSKLLGD